MQSYLSNGWSGYIVDHVNRLIEYARVYEGRDGSCFWNKFEISPDADQISGFIGHTKIFGNTINVRILWSPGYFYKCVSRGTNAYYIVRTYLMIVVQGRMTLRHLQI
jgi:hypothetical protein